MTLSKESHGKEFSNNMEKGPPRDTNAKFQKTANLVHLQLVNPSTMRYAWVLNRFCLKYMQTPSKLNISTFRKIVLPMHKPWIKYSFFYYNICKLHVYLAGL